MSAKAYTIPPTIEDGGSTLLAWLRDMRDEHPVWRDAYTIWHVFRYADVARAISDPRVFSSEISRVFPVGEKFAQGNLTRTDPPRHHTLRGGSVRCSARRSSWDWLPGSPRSPASCSTPPVAPPSSTSSRRWPTRCRSP